jgi:hypothetical protein
MKEYFKYANGFININDDNLFLTNSGNWSETYDLKEKSSKSNFKTNKIYLNYLFVIVLIGLGIYDVLKDAKNKSFPFGIVLIGLGVLAFLKREKGKRYKIPLSKIIKITVSNNATTIIFYDENDLEDIEEITHIETKGLHVFEQIKQQFNL